MNVDPRTGPLLSGCSVGSKLNSEPQCQMTSQRDIQGHVRRKWLQLLTNVKLMRGAGAAGLHGTPTGQLYSKWPPAGRWWDEDISLQWYLAVFERHGCRDNYSDCWGTLDRCMLCIYPGRLFCKCACRHIWMHILEGSKYSQRSAKKLISLANI